MSPQDQTEYEMWMAEVMSNGLSLEHVPTALQTPEMRLEAVKRHGYALEFVPKELRTVELCVEAVKQNAGATQFVPRALRTPAFLGIIEAVRSQSSEADLSDHPS